MRTQVGIVGAGPAGLMLSHLLGRAGIESVVLENRSQAYVEQRVRAGVLEHDTAALLDATGVGARMRSEGLVHHGLELRFARTRHRVPLSELTGGRTIVVYGQQEVVKDLAAARRAAGGAVHYEVDDVRVEGMTSTRPVIRFHEAGRDESLECDFVCGCDGFHGVCRPAIPTAALSVFDWHYPFSWLGILAQVPPSTDELIYARHERGFALHSLRSPELSRLYLQVSTDDDLAAWSDERIWEELARRFETDDGFVLHEGPILEKSITEMRSFVVEPMRYGRLFLAGDAAHIVPPTGAKGLNLAIFDVRVLAAGLAEYYRSGREDLLEAYSAICLERVWRVQHFSWSMTSMLHRFAGLAGPAGRGAIDDRLNEAALRFVASSPAAMAALAQQYVGLADDRFPLE